MSDASNGGLFANMFNSFLEVHSGGSATSLYVINGKLCSLSISSTAVVSDVTTMCNSIHLVSSAEVIIKPFPLNLLNVEAFLVCSEHNYRVSDILPLDTLLKCLPSPSLSTVLYGGNFELHIVNLEDVEEVNFLTPIDAGWSTGAILNLPVPNKLMYRMFEKAPDHFKDYLSVL